MSESADSALVVSSSPTSAVAVSPSASTGVVPISTGSPLSVISWLSVLSAFFSATDAMTIPSFSVASRAFGVSVPEGTRRPSSRRYISSAVVSLPVISSPVSVPVIAVVVPIISLPESVARMTSKGVSPGSSSAER